MMKTETGSAGSGRRAIVLIPGMMREERGLRRQVLADNMAAVVQHRRLSIGGEVRISGETGQRIDLRTPDDGDGNGWPQQIDLFEAYWADMIPEPSALSPWRKLWNGFDLLFFWLLDWRSWRAFAISPTISIGLVVGALLLLLWYASLILIAAQALSKTGLPSDLAKIEQIKTLFDDFVGWTTEFRAWQVWILVAALLNFIRVDELVGLARTTKQYLENRVIPTTEDKRDVGLRDRMRERILATLERVLNAGYDEVVVVSHSFGTVIAVDALREWPDGKALARLRLVTLGSPLAVLRCRSEWLRRELDGLLESGRLPRWTDYFATTDWMCKEVPGHRAAYDGQTHRLDFEAPWAQRLTGQTHMLYYRDQTVLTDLAAPWQPVPPSG